MPTTERAGRHEIRDAPVRDERHRRVPHLDQLATVETYAATPSGLERALLMRDGTTVVQTLLPGWDGPLGEVEPDLAERLLLTANEIPLCAQSGEAVVVDLFAGAGGLSLGVAQALRAVGLSPRFLGVDTDAPSRRVYSQYLAGAEAIGADVMQLFDGRLHASLTAGERDLRRRVGSPRFLLGGPPCQGHSAFNNRTRHDDPKNALYLSMVRAAEVLEPEHVIVENVPGALRDRSGVVQRAIAGFAELGFAVSHATVDLATIGVAQRRKRLLVVASRNHSPDLRAAAALHARSQRSVRWAIEDLEDVIDASPINTPANSAPQTRVRIDRLFEGGLYDLPNEYRPPCHQKGDHSYRSIYGRLRWDEPAQTVTTGFYSMCMGRNVHPSRRRTITAHEAARLQHLPDWFSLEHVTQKTDLARLIGNTVPPRLGFVAAIELLR